MFYEIKKYRKQKRQRLFLLVIFSVALKVLFELTQSLRKFRVPCRIVTKNYALDIDRPNQFGLLKEKN